MNPAASNLLQGFRQCRPAHMGVSISHSWDGLTVSRVSALKNVAKSSPTRTALAESFGDRAAS